MTREEKAAIIEELSSKLQKNNYFYITDASGMSVAETNDFRRACFNKGIEYKVYKNTLIEKALESIEGDNDLSELKGTLKGFSGIMFAEEIGNAPAKVLKEVRKDADKPLLKGAYIDSDVFVGDDQIDALAKLKSKHELIGEVVGLLQSPVKNVLGALQSGGHTISGLLKALSEKEG
jgi:large subunit ribosomal protein L10